MSRATPGASERELDPASGAAARGEDARRDKAPGAFRTISEVSEELEIPAHVLRFWESKFPHLNPMKRGGGRRYYRPADVALLKGIQRMLYDEGLTIKGLQKLFRERGPRFVAGVGEGADPAGPFDDEAAPDPAAQAADEALAAPAEARARARLLGVIAKLERARDALQER
ncbi:MAG: MerR family transcriptional regulator [Rubrimonas sp.]